MTRSESAHRTADLMRDNADELERAEAILHRSAEASPREQTTRRLHQLGDAVTAQAHAIVERADRLDADSATADARGPAAR